MYYKKYSFLSFLKTFIKLTVVTFIKLTVVTNILRSSNKMTQFFRKIYVITVKIMCVNRLGRETEGIYH